jgi:hypothetical protein
LFRQDPSNNAVELKLAWPKSVPTDSGGKSEDEAVSRSYRFSVKSALTVGDGPFLVQTKKLLWQNKSKAIWQATPAVTGENSFAAILSSKTDVAALLREGRFLQPFSITSAANIPNEAIHFISGKSLVSSLPELNTDKEFVQKWSEFTGAELAFSGKYDEWLSHGEIASLTKEKWPEVLNGVSYIYPYENGTNLRFETPLLKSFGGVQKLLNTKPWPVFVKSPKIVWDTKRRAAGLGDLLVAPANFKQVREESALFRTTVIRLGGTNGPVFPSLKSVALDKYPFLVAVANAEMQLNYSVNGEKTETQLRQGILDAFASLERLSQTQILVAIVEIPNGIRATIVGRNELGAVEQRQEVFQGALPANWFRSLMGFDHVVSARVGGEITVKTSSPCRVGAQGVVLYANTAPFFPKDTSAVPDAIVECVRSSQQQNMYKIIWEKSANIVKPWSRVWLAN